MKPTTGGNPITKYRYLVMILALITGCASVPDVPICVDLTNKDALAIPKGFCAWTISDKETIVDDNGGHMLNGKLWTDVKSSSLLIPAESWAKIKAFILKNCKKNKDCNASGLGKWEKP